MIGQKLGSFRIEAELGSGAMGVVYRGVQEGKDRQVAIMVISNEQIGKGKAFERFDVVLGPTVPIVAPCSRPLTRSITPTAPWRLNFSRPSRSDRPSTVSPWRADATKSA